jgi:hypothetical protein
MIADLKPDLQDRFAGQSWTNISGRPVKTTKINLRSPHQQNLKNLLGLSALSGTFSIVSKTNRGNKYYKFDKLTIYSGIYYIKYFKNSQLWWSMQRYTEYAQNT